MKPLQRLAVWGGFFLIALIAVVFIRARAFSLESGSGEFRPPNATQRAKAVGSLRGLDKSLRAAFDAGDPRFSRTPNPGPSDWLANHNEAGQTFEQYRRGQPNRPDDDRSTIYLLPIGEMDPNDSNGLDLIARYAEAFFMMPVKMLPKVSDRGLPVTERDNGGTRQMLSTDILEWLAPRVPTDAYCLLAVTMVDLYPDPNWNFVFGQASLRNRVGVYSFARYAPSFRGQPASQKSDALMLRRSCNVLAHETGHMFGIKHCIHFHCLMNGSNNLQESDRQPNHLCPACLRKMHWAKPFDIFQRYQKLKTFAEEAGWEEEAKWLAERSKRIR